MDKQGSMMRMARIRVCLAVVTANFVAATFAVSWMGPTGARAEGPPFIERLGDGRLAFAVRRDVRWAFEEPYLARVEMPWIKDCQKKFNLPFRPKANQLLWNVGLAGCYADQLATQDLVMFRLYSAEDLILDAKLLQLMKPPPASVFVFFNEKPLGPHKPYQKPRLESFHKPFQYQDRLGYDVYYATPTRLRDWHPGDEKKGGWTGYALPAEKRLTKSTEPFLIGCGNWAGPGRECTAKVTTSDGRVGVGMTWSDAQHSQEKWAQFDLLLRTLAKAVILNDQWRDME